MGLGRRGLGPGRTAPPQARHLVGPNSRYEALAVLPTEHVTSLGSDSARAKGLLLYDGVHFDPVAFSPAATGLRPLEEGTELPEELDIRLFSPPDTHPVNLGKQLARALRAKVPGLCDLLGSLHRHGKVHPSLRPVRCGPSWREGCNVACTADWPLVLPRVQMIVSCSVYTVSLPLRPLSAFSLSPSRPFYWPLAKVEVGLGVHLISECLLVP